MSTRKTKTLSPKTKAKDIEVPSDSTRSSLSIVVRKDESQKIHTLAALSGTTASQFIRDLLHKHGCLENKEPAFK